MQFEWTPIVKGSSAGLRLAEKLCRSEMGVEGQLREWLAVDRSIRICSGETTGTRKPSVCIVYEENGVELGEGEMRLTDFMQCCPHIAPVTDAFKDEWEISRLSDESEVWFNKRDRRAGRFWDDEFCVDRTDLSGAIDIAWSYATANSGEAFFSVNSEQETELFLEDTDPARRPNGRIVAVHYGFRAPASGQGFGEWLTVFMDEVSPESVRGAVSHQVCKWHLN